MLPFDNKNDFLIVADTPNDTPLESTQQALKDFGRYLTSVSEVDNVVTFAGEGAPIDFNGLVRHYYLMKGPWVGQIRVNLAEKERRSAASHAITLWIRPALEEIAKKYKVRLKIAEVPPGPPVLQTLVGEVYGPPGASYASIIKEADRIKANFLKTKGVVDVDTTVETAEPRFRFLVDRQKAALSGLSDGPNRPGAGHGRGRGDGGPGARRRGTAAPGNPAPGTVGLALLHLKPRATLFQESPRRHGALAGTGAFRPGPGPQIHHAEKSGKGGLRHRGHGRRQPG